MSDVPSQPRDRITIDTPDATARGDTLLWMPAGGNQADTIGANSHLYAYVPPAARDTMPLAELENGALNPKVPAIGVDIGLLHVSRAYGDDHEEMITPDWGPILAGQAVLPSDQGGVVPDVSAILLTHGHSDHIAGLAPTLKAGIDVPTLYTAPYTAELVRAHLITNDVDEARWPDIVEINPGDELQFGGDITVHVTGATHTIPQALSFVIETPAGRHYHSGDLTGLQDALISGGTNFDDLRRFGQKGIDSALLDSTAAITGGQAKSWTAVRETMSDILESHPSKRVTIAMVGSYVEQLASMVEAATKDDRAFVYQGKAIETHLAALAPAGIDLPGLIEERTGKRPQILSAADPAAKALPPGKVMMAITGVDGSEGTPLSMAANGTNDHWRISADDVIVWPNGFRAEDPAQPLKVEKLLRQKRASILRPKSRKEFGEGHGRADELRDILSALKPKTVMPTHGVTKMHTALGAIAAGIGVDTLSVRNGDVVAIDGKGPRLQGHYGIEWRGAGHTHYPDDPGFTYASQVTHTQKGQGASRSNSLTGPVSALPMRP